MTNWDSLLNPKFIYLILGVIFLSLAVVSAFTGKTIARYKGSIYRAKEPIDFWGTVGIYFVGSILFIGTYLHSVFPEAIFHPERWLR
jgi:hypothetical protein